MPKGKGTYGSKVGRPPKKYQAGGEVFNPVVEELSKMSDAAEMGEELKSIPLDSVDSGIPSVDAANRVQNFQMGGEVQQYDKGGKVDVTDVVKSAENAKRFQLKEEEFPDMPSFTKKKKLHRRKTKKMAKKILEE